MFICNASIGLSHDGDVVVNLTRCTEVEYSLENGNGTNTTSVERDAYGAMQYTLSVVLLYGVAVIGVFGLSHLSRRKNMQYRADTQVNEFLKNYDEVRRLGETRSRVGVISRLLHNLHDEPDTSGGRQKTRPSINSLAFLPISLSKLGEGTSSVSENILLNNAPINHCAQEMETSFCDLATYVNNLENNANEPELCDNQKGAHSLKKDKEASYPKVATVLGSRRTYSNESQSAQCTVLSDDIVTSKQSYTTPLIGDEHRKSLSCQTRRSLFQKAREERQKFLDRRHSEVEII